MQKICRKIPAQKHDLIKIPLKSDATTTRTPTMADRGKCVRCGKDTALLCLGCIKSNLCLMCQSSPSTDFCASCFDDTNSKRQDVIRTVRRADEKHWSTNNYLKWRELAPRYVWRRILIAEGEDPRKEVTTVLTEMSGPEKKILRTLILRLSKNFLRKMRRVRRQLIKEGFTHKQVDIYFP